MRTLALHHPPAPSLEVHRRAAGRGIAVIEVRGELDLFTAPGLRAALTAALQDARAIVVDLRGVTFIDSTGVVALVHAHRAVDDGKRFCVARTPDGPVARLFTRIRAEQIFPVCDGPDAALAELS